MVAVAASVASAQTTIVAPNGFAMTDGSAIADGPIDDAGDRFQQVYSGSFFGGPVLITEIQFRAANPENSFRPNSITASDVLVTLSTTLSEASAAGIASAFDDNVGSDVQTVLTGMLTLDRGGSNATGPQPFEYGFVLDTPFAFDPSFGNLLLDVSVPSSASIALGSGFGALESFDAVVDQPDIDGIASKTGNFGATSTGLVTQFTTVPVPEPGSGVTLLGAGAFVLFRRLSR
ncbi:hypothetical protein [Posidoniimonas polymericola]|nr:hypothetical protein [Posidoniimonas polymericola]